MKERLRQIITYKTNGKIGEFGRLFGWSPQYTSALLKKEGGIGLKVIQAILDAMPEINARWLILGEGSMLDGRSMSDKIIELLSIEKYLPVLSPDELSAFIYGNKSFTEQDKARWQGILDIKQAQMDNMFEKAYDRMRAKNENA